MGRKTKVSLTLERDLVERVDRIAKAAGETRSGQIEALIAEGIDQHELFVKTASQPKLMQAIMRAFAEPGVLRQLASIMREDLDEEQLNLFQQTMGALGALTSGMRDVDPSAIRPKLAASPKGGAERPAKRKRGKR